MASKPWNRLASRSIPAGHDQSRGKNHVNRQRSPSSNAINQLYLTRVTLNSRVTDKPVALEFQIELEFRNVSFWGGRKTGGPGEKPSEQGRELTTNSTHIWRRVRESNPGHIGGRRALSPLRHPCSPNPSQLSDVSMKILAFSFDWLIFIPGEKRGNIFH